MVLALAERASGFLSTGSAKAGTIMLIALTAISLFVVATYPLDYGVRFWNNPSLWVDNPKAVPPSWVSMLTGSREFEHEVLESRSPAERLVGEDVYVFSFVLDADKAPTLLSISMREITYHSSPPFIVATITRPDGSAITLLRRSVAGPRDGEEPPIKRYYESPLHVYLGGDESAMNSLLDFLSSRYGIRLSSRELRGRYEEALFGVPVIGEPLSFEPLRGRYEVRVRFVKGSPEDSVGSVKVVAGGTVFGAMGTDSVGRDIALGLLFGFPVALFIGLLASTLATVTGSALGMLSGYLGGKVDTLIQRASDIVANVPLLPILIFLSFLFRPNLLLIILILVAFGWPGLTIVVRSMVLQARASGFVEAAVALGVSKMRIIARHIFPQVAPFVISQMIFFVPSAILAEAALSFLGLGDPTIPTWGQILELGFRTGGVFTGYWWWVLPPGLLIVITAMTFVLLALGMEPIINPRLRRMR